MSLFDNIPCPALLTDDEGQVLRANAAFDDLVAHVAGTEAEPNEYKNLESYLTLASRIFLQTHLWPMLRVDGKLDEVFVKLSSAKHGVLPLMVNGVFLPDGDSPRYCWTLFVAKERDRFERELIETKQEVENINLALSSSQKALAMANSQLAVSNQELERFAGAVSHDIKAPLITISAFADKLLRETVGTLTPRHERLLDRIKVNADHLKTMVNEILQLSRLSSCEFEKSILDTHQISLGLADLLETSLQKARGMIVVDASLPSISANSALFTQCLQNLLSNAIHYCEPTRDLHISITGYTDLEHDVIQVRDNGIGIKKEHFERIFVLFEHLEASKGTGVGLSTVSTIMAKHVGQVTVESEFGIGSCFSLRFPR